MDYKETSVILGILKAAYPMAYKGMDKETGMQTVALWQQILGEYPKEVVEGVVKAYISQDHEYPPSVGRINTEIKKLSAPPQMSAMQAWSLVEKSIDYYDATENFNKLPKDIQEVLGSPKLLHDWAMEDIKSMPVNASNFMKSYQAHMKRKEEMAMLPESVTKLLEVGNGKKYRELVQETV